MSGLPPRFIATGCPSSSSRPATPPSPLRSSNISFIRASLSAIVMGFDGCLDAPSGTSFMGVLGRVSPEGRACVSFDAELLDKSIVWGTDVATQRRRESEGNFSVFWHARNVETRLMFQTSGGDMDDGEGCGQESTRSIQFASEKRVLLTSRCPRP